MLKHLVLKKNRFGQLSSKRYRESSVESEILEKFERRKPASTLLTNANHHADLIESVSFFAGVVPAPL